MTFSSISIVFCLHKSNFFRLAAGNGHAGFLGNTLGTRSDETFARQGAFCDENVLGIGAVHGVPVIHHDPRFAVPKKLGRRLNLWFDVDDEGFGQVLALLGAMRHVPAADIFHEVTAGGERLFSEKRMQGKQFLRAAPLLHRLERFVASWRFCLLRPVVVGGKPHCPLLAVITEAGGPFPGCF